uniref:Ciliary microtubule inner protein 2C n=1 Tax=Apteryx owenii TaxID=8824 RepID=A0A8B9S5Q9_APTOW
MSPGVFTECTYRSCLWCEKQAPSSQQAPHRTHALPRRYRRHVPNITFSFGDTSRNATMKYLQDFWSTATERSHQLPTLSSSRPAPACRARGWHQRPCIPLHSQSSLGTSRVEELRTFYQLSQQHQEFYRDKTGTLHVVPYFALPAKEKERYPHPLDLPPLSGKTRWHLFRVSPENLRTYRTFPSGKRVTSQERETSRDIYFFEL